MIRGILQGFVLGPVLYTLYMAPLHHIISSHHLSAHYYADDTQICFSCKLTELHTAIARLEVHISDMFCWLMSNNLAFNAAKSEMLLFSTKQLLAKVTQPVVARISDSAVSSSQTARNFGIWLNSMLSFDHHVDAICHGCYANIRRLARIWKYLSTESAAILGSAIVACKLDYCNSLLSGVSHFNITRLQRVQHRLVRVIFKLPS